MYHLHYIPTLGMLCSQKLLISSFLLNSTEAIINSGLILHFSMDRFITALVYPHSESLCRYIHFLPLCRGLGVLTFKITVFLP